MYLREGLEGTWQEAVMPRGLTLPSRRHMSRVVNLTHNTHTYDQHNRE
jgi:hypothetical protein